MIYKTTTKELVTEVPRQLLRGMAERVETKSSASWTQQRTRNALALFHSAAARVPAYKAFLKARGIKPNAIESWADFQEVPQTSKNDYLRKYSLEDLCWDGNLARPAVFSSTSGSTGKPFFFQRIPNLEEEYSVITELFLRNGAKRPGTANPTLVIIGFGMGVWIGGMLTYRAFDIASRRGLPVSILPIGVNKDEIITALKDLAPNFKQTVLIGYPPFVKDVLEEAERKDVNLKALNIRLLFAAESFSENFRDYLAEKIGTKNVLRDTLNIYGTADIGAMAFETPISILIRRLAVGSPKLFTRIFGDIHKLPTLAQYNPAFITFEAQEGEILLTGYSAVPLVRYAVGDQGGVYTYDELKTLLSEEGIDIEREAKKHNIPVYELPFVYVYARSDLSTKLYGAIIYPEHVRDALESDEMRSLTSGKFTMQTLMDDKHDEYLEINIELMPGVQAGSEVEKNLSDAIVASLNAKNGEYHYLYNSTRERVIPHLVLWPHGDPNYFKPGIKQKWVLKK